MTTPIDTLLHTRWIVPVVPRNVVQEYHSIAIQGTKIIDILPTDQAKKKYCAKNTLNRTDHVVMPGLSGPDVAARLHAIQPSMKVLYMSGFATEYVQARGLREGDPLLVKPFSPETLLSKVRAMLASRSRFARRPGQPSRSTCPQTRR